MTVRLWKSSVVVPVAVLLLCTCESFPTLPTLPPSPESIAAAAGLPASSTVGSELIASVIVRDASGNILPHAQVTFAVTSGGGSVNPVATLADDNGRAATQWTLGTTASEQRLVATAGTKTASFVVFSTADVATQIAVSPGASGQVAPPGTAVPIPPSVIVRDAHFNPKAGVTVTFAVASGGGSITGSTATTNANGVATVGSWTLGPIAQTNTLTATSPGLTGSPVTITATSAAVGGTLSVNAGNGQTATVNSPVNVAPSVVIRDANSNPVVGATVTFAVTAGGGSVTGGTTQTNGSGIATVGSWTLGTLAGINTLMATSTSGTATFTAVGIAGPAVTLAINGGNSQTTTAGSQVPVPPSVILRDAFGNPVDGALVTFVVTSGGGSVSGGSTTTNPNGVATVGSWTLGAAAGANSLTASSGTLTPVTFTATGTAGTGSVSVNAGNNQTATVNTPVAVLPSVIIKDVNGNPVANVSVTFAVASGGGSVSGATTTTGANGIATVGGWTLGTTAGTNTLTATSTLGSATFTAAGVAGPASQIAVNSGNNQTGVAGAQLIFSPSVIVRDAFGNPKGGVQVTFAVTSGGGTITGATPTTSADGVARVGSWRLGPTAGVNTLSVTSAGILTGSPVTFTATGTPGPAQNMTVNAGDNQSAVAGTAVAVPPSVLVKDVNNNPVAGVVVTFAVASGGGTVTGSPATTNASGIATVGRWTLGGSAGSNTLTASSAGLPSVTFSATATIGTAAVIDVNTGNGQSAVAGSAVATPPSVIVTDVAGNPVGGVTVTFAVGSGGGSATGLVAVTDGSGIATVGSWTLGSTLGLNTLTATSPGLTGSPVTFSATAVAGPPASITINAGDAQTAPAGTAVPIAPSVIVKDAAGNPVSGVTVTFAVATGGGTPTGAIVVTGANGIATVGSWILGAAPGANTLTATAGSLSVTFSATAQ